MATLGEVAQPFPIQDSCTSKNASHRASQYQEKRINRSQNLCFVKALVDALYSTGDPISPQEQMDLILEGLPEKCDSLINLVSTCYGDSDLDELEALLLA